jgi:hypothetical protein
MQLASRFILIALSVLFLTVSAPPSSEALAAQQAAARPGSGPIACRVMERHADKDRGIILILFHQRDKPDQPRLKDFLVLHDGGTIEIQSGSADWQKVTVWRIKNCFGRGLFVVPDSAAPKEKAIFKIRAVQ